MAGPGIIEPVGVRPYGVDMTDPKQEKQSTDKQPIAGDHHYEVRVAGQASAALSADLGCIRTGETSS